MSLKFYERIGYDNRRPSPFSWRIRYALAHKKLSAEVIPVKFSDVDRIVAISDQRLVPVIEHDGKVVTDSWNIACYLEQTFPERPSLFGCSQGQAAANFISRWADEILHPMIRYLVLPDFLHSLEERDRSYFRESRERMLGHSLEDCANEHSKYADMLNVALEPLRKTLDTQPFLAGNSAAYMDYVVFAAFQFARGGGVRPTINRKDDDILNSWLSEMMLLFDGLANEFPFMPLKD